MSVRARVEHDVVHNKARLVVVRQQGDSEVILMEDGTWQTITPNALPDVSMGLPLPQDTLPAISEAFASYLGHALPSQGEISTLREWLDVERGRVQMVFDAAVLRVTQEGEG